MSKMDFGNKALERLFRSFKWARNNSLQIFEAARDQNILNATLAGEGQQSILYQFQCLITTTDAYYRRLAGSADKRFGVLVGEYEIAKKDIAADDIKQLFARQVVELEHLFKGFDAAALEAHIADIQAICNHEYMHQGQLLVMFSQLGGTLPERFRTAFAL